MSCYGSYTTNRIWNRQTVEHIHFVLKGDEEYGSKWLNGKIVDIKECSWIVMGGISSMWDEGVFEDMNELIEKLEANLF